MLIGSRVYSIAMRNSRKASRIIVVIASLIGWQTSSAAAQTGMPKIGVPSSATVPDPATPAASNFHDSRFGVSFKVPAAWSQVRHDAEVSTFAYDVRTAPPSSLMRGLATIAFNPHPTSTFSGALFYFSVTPHLSEDQCRLAASAQAPRAVTTAQLGGETFTHGYDEHGTICTESRDEIYTALRKGACYRFDLVINTFCGEGSGMRDISPAELNDVFKRLQSILSTVTFDQK